MALSRRFSEAVTLASELHRDQYRKTSRRVPYVSHLLAVAAIVLEHGGTEDHAIAALLHDAVEDQGGSATLDMIRRLFGAEVADIVSGCSDSDTVPKPPWRQRKDAYLTHLKEARDGVLLVSAADKLANARSLIAGIHEEGDRIWERFTAGRLETLWYYRSVAEVLRGRLPGALLAELERAVSELERLSDSAPPARLRS
jgi:(p)ppGpp synthase/HD superfamily hydrolase